MLILTRYTVQDRASGVGGEFVIVERRSDRQRRRSSAGGASGAGGARGGASGSEDPSLSRRSSAEASSPTRRADGHRRERVNSDTMFSEAGTFPIARFKREQDEDVVTNLVLRLVDTMKRPRWAPTVRISLSECRVNAHRVWRRGAAVSPHAVLISEVRGYLRDYPASEGRRAAPLSAPCAGPRT